MSKQAFEKIKSGLDEAIIIAPYVAEIERLRAENEKLHEQAAINGRLLTENSELREENRLVGLQMDRMADKIEKLRAELKDNISFIRKQADEIAELRKAAALKETGG